MIELKVNEMSPNKKPEPNKKKKQIAKNKKYKYKQKQRNILTRFVWA